MVKPTLFLFDVDGTLAESGTHVDAEVTLLLEHLVMIPGVELGVVGGGTYDKIFSQLVRAHRIITHYFSECGTVYHKKIIDREYGNYYLEIYKHDIRQHPQYANIQRLVKKALAFIADVDYNLCGHIVDIRTGIVYISLLGMTADASERCKFFAHDPRGETRKRLMDVLNTEKNKLGISDSQITISEGGRVGIAIFPTEFDKVQVLKSFSSDYSQIYFFGDKYDKNGNDHKLINLPRS